LDLHGQLGRRGAVDVQNGPRSGELAPRGEEARIQGDRLLVEADGPPQANGICRALRIDRARPAAATPTPAGGHPQPAAGVCQGRWMPFRAGPFPRQISRHGLLNPLLEGEGSGERLGRASGYLRGRDDWRRDGIWPQRGTGYWGLVTTLTFEGGPPATSRYWNQRPEGLTDVVPETRVA
jgi:hypothetical protein